MTRRVLQRIATVLLMVAGVISLVLWSLLPASLPARGRFHGFELDTTVDSESAQYYIESYAQGRVNDPQLHQAIDQLKRDFGDRIPNHLDLHGCTGSRTRSRWISPRCSSQISSSLSIETPLSTGGSG